MENKRVIYNNELISEYKSFYDKRKIFEDKIKLHSYFTVFSKWLSYYINDDIYRKDLFNSLQSENREFRTKIDIDTIKEIAHDFFHSLGGNIGNSYDSITSKDSNIILNIDKDILGKKIEDTSFSSISDDLVDGDLYGLLQVKNNESIETLYGFVHECMHALTTVDHKFNQSTYTIIEVPSYFCETLLGDYLEQNYKKYNLNKEDVKHDTYLWKLLRYFDYINFKTESYNAEYFLAQILNCSYERLTPNEKNQQLKLLLYYLRIDRIDIALKSINFNLGSNTNIDNSKYLKNMTSNFIYIINKLTSNENNMSNEEIYESNIVK